jgi:hypothetical protein
MTGPWTGISQRGLAYRADDDSFYVGGWNEGILYHVKGLSQLDKGAVIGQCSPADGSISGLGYNAAFNVVWAATNSPHRHHLRARPRQLQRAHHAGAPDAGLQRRRAGASRSRSPSTRPA